MGNKPNSSKTSQGRHAIRRKQLPEVGWRALVAVVCLLVLAFSVAWYLWPRPETHQPPGVDSSLDLTTSASRDNVVAIMVATAQSQAQQANRLRILDPLKDGWETEDLAEKSEASLQVLAGILEQVASVKGEQLDTIVSSDFTCVALRPSSLSEVHRDKALVVRRNSNEPNVARSEEFRGPAGLQRALDGLAAGLGETNRRVKFKIVRVRPAESEVAVTVYYEGSGRTAAGTIQQTATWDTQWSRDATTSMLRLTSIKVDDFEEAAIQSQHATLFADCTESVIADNRAYREQLVHGAGHWMERLEGRLSTRLLEAPNGLALGDVNGDSLDDVYFCQPGGLPDRLFLQNNDGTVTDASQQAGIDILDWSYSALLVDLDNDADQDLAVLTSAQILLFENDGAGHFTPRTPLDGTYEYSLSAADYDQDGDLDLYACNYFSEGTDDFSIIGRRDPLFDANGGGHNALFRNDGDLNFTDVTKEVGLDENNTRLSRAAAWEDFDNDGDLDLYVANDFGHNNLYRNDGGSFHDLAPAAGAVDANFGMSVTWGDYDCDGLMDVYVSNMFSSAGNRITFQRRFKQHATDETRSLFQQMARGNTLLRNIGDGTFRDVSAGARVTMGRWAWGSLFADINNDSWEDLLVTNGYLTQETTADL